uniref:Uncharacterized protein n=1 Tax=Sphaerodactylus townsendi TaxID=933632 RepID=A0ACB8FBN9_9SAUR
MPLRVRTEEYATRVLKPKTLLSETLFSLASGIVLSNGHTWKQQRKFAVVALRKLGLGKKGLEHQIEEEAHQLLQTFANAKETHLFKLKS